MFYIFNQAGAFIATSDNPLNLDDLNSRNEIAIESSQNFGTDIYAKEGEIKEIPVQPSIYHTFDLSQERWILPTEMIPTIKETLWEEIKAERYRRNHSGIYIEEIDKWFHTDEPSRIQYLSIQQLAEIPEGMQWKTMENTFVVMTKALLNQIVTAMLKNEQANFANAEQHREKMMALDNPVNYDYSSGWTPIYAEINKEST